MKFYNELAKWWHLLSLVEDYAEEVDFFWKVLQEAGVPAFPTLLELGAGGGNNAFHLKKQFTHLTLTDLSPQMLAMSQTINPECTHFVGDMRTIRLSQQFDVVFIHDAIDYMTSPEALRQAMQTAFVHCKPGGMALFVPDHVRETFEPATDHGGHNGDGRALRYLEWSYDPNPNDSSYVVEYVFVLREENQPVQVEHEQHICGLFPQATWVALLQEVGFQSQTVSDPFERVLFLAHKPFSK